MIEKYHIATFTQGGEYSPSNWIFTSPAPRLIHSSSGHVRLSYVVYHSLIETVLPGGLETSEEECIANIV